MMRFIQQYRRLLPIGTLTLTMALVGLFSGCQTAASDPNPPDSEKPGSKDSIKANPDDKASLTLLSPKEGDIYELGDSLHVTATAEGNDQGTIDSIDVFLSPDGGQTWGAISDRSLPLDAKTSFGYSWKIPAYFDANGKRFSLAENNGCMVRIAQRNTGDSLKRSISGRFKFEDTAFIRLSYPLGGESFKVGDTVRISWNTKNDLNNYVDAVDVKVSPDSGKTWANLRPSSITEVDPVWRRVPWIVTDSITIRGQKANIVGNPGVCVRVEQYTTSDPKMRSQSGMISIMRP